MGVYEYLLEEIRRHGSIHLTLLDPDKIDIEKFIELCRNAERSGSSAIMVGGSLGVNERLLDDYLEAAKKEVKIPFILFPGNIAGLSNKADALFYLSVLNSLDPYYIIGAQVQASILIAKRYRSLDIIPMAYIIVGEGGAAGYVSNARMLPFERDDIIIAYALAAKYLGFSVIYLEAGSGAKEPMRPSIIAKMKKLVDKPVMVGGGIRTPEVAYSIALAGADMVVTGTVVEESPSMILSDIVNAVHKGGMDRIGSDLGNKEPKQ
jgi:phosphoglycerol geranylgeranyltransferase